MLVVVDAFQNDPANTAIELLDEVADLLTQFSRGLFHPFIFPSANATDDYTLVALRELNVEIPAVGLRLFSPVAKNG